MSFRLLPATEFGTNSRISNVNNLQENFDLLESIAGPSTRNVVDRVRMRVGELFGWIDT